MTAPRTLLAILAIVCTVQTLDSQVSVFSSRIDVVRINALVTSRGQPVQGLEAGDFEVRDNGVLQDVELVGPEQTVTNVVLGVDVSASVSGERLQHLQEAGRALLNQLTRGDRAALVTFSQQVRLEQQLTDDVSRVRERLDAVTTSRGTALADGTYVAIAAAGEHSGRNAVILFCDGVDTDSWLTAETVTETVRRSDVVVYGVTIGGRHRPTFLRTVSENTGGSLIEIESTQDLSRAFLQILEELRRRYLISYVPRGVSPSGSHRIDVRVKNRSATVRARAEYRAGASP